MAISPDAMEVFLEALVTGDSSRAIENQEARGQRKFVANQTLPKQCQGCTLMQLEAMGIIFGKAIDDLFVEAQLPNGWKKVPTSHNMWSHLVDEKGRKRASIFYKAAFYDRDAFISLERRFAALVEPLGKDADPNYDYDTAPRIAVVRDCGKIIWESKPLKMTGIRPYQARDVLYPQAKAWLDEHYPNWQDPLAYWDLL